MTTAQPLTELAAKGQKQWEAFVEKLAEHGPDRDTAAHYSERYRSQTTEKAGLPANATVALASLGLRTDHCTKYTTRAEDGKDAYVNYYDPTQGVIVASWNYAKHDSAVSGKRLTLSEILYNQYADEANRLRQPVDRLQFVVRSSLENGETQRVISLCLAGHVRLRNVDASWPPGSEQFLSLFATDNVKSVPFLLGDHRNSLGRRSVTQIVTHGTSYLYLKLGTPAVT